MADNIAKASLTIDGGILVRVDTCRTDTFERTVSDKLQFDHFGDTRGNETIVREVDSCRRKKKYFIKKKTKNSNDLEKKKKTDRNRFGFRHGNRLSRPSV